MMGSKDKRSTNWQENEIKALIKQWQENFEDLRKTKRNGHVYRKMTSGLKSVGIIRSCEEVKIKIQNLTGQFRKEKIKLNSEGGPSKWIFFEEVNKIIGKIPRLGFTTFEDNCQECLSDEVKIDVIEEPQLIQENFNQENEVSLQEEIHFVEIQSSTSDNSMQDIPLSQNSNIIKRRKLNNHMPKNSNQELLLQLIKDEKERDEKFQHFLDEQLKLQKESLQLQKDFLEVLKSSFSK